MLKGKRFKFLVALWIFYFLCLTYSPVFAGPTSSTYELKQYGFGSGGTEGANSTTYSLFGIAGENELGRPTSTTYALGSGLTYTLQANVPPAPTFTNPGSNYDRLKIVVNTGGNPSDTQFAIAISSDNFATDTRYVQSDYTVGSTLGSEDWMTYAGGAGTGWGGASGFYVTGLLENTTYTIKVAARQGNFTQVQFGPTAQVATSVPSLTFGISATSLNINLNTGNSYSDTTQSTVLTTSTNAYNGYIVYGRNTGALTYGSNTILDYSSPNSAPTVWSGTGFGYSTNDSNLSGGTANRFTSGGPKYAGFSTSTPGDPVADTAGPILTPISAETYTISYEVTTTNIKPAGPYRTTVIYVIVPTY